jgi:nicotinamidase-related amidase
MRKSTEKNKGDDTLLTPDNHALLLIDHQYLQLLAVRSHPNETVVNNTVFLAKTAKLFKVPTVVLQSGEATGDVNEAALRRIQIREAVKAARPVTVKSSSFHITSSFRPLKARATSTASMPWTPTTRSW